MTVGILTIGDELTTGRVVDCHGAFLSRRLADRGIEVCTHLSVGDEVSAIVDALRWLDTRCRSVIVTGGLGPTEDDRTRGAVASAAGVDLEFRETSWSGIQDALQGRNLAVSAHNRRQAYFPVGAIEIPNRFGTAPAFRVEREHGAWWVLPGVPFELEQLADEVVLPSLDEMFRGRAGVAVFQALQFFGVPEAELDAWLAAQVGDEPYRICVSDGELDVRVPQSLDLLAKARGSWGQRFLGPGDLRLAERLVADCQQRGLSFAVGESCSGGLLGSRITAVPGASSVFRGGLITYADTAKEELAGVPGDLLATHGAVSDPVARALATGAADRLDVPLAVAITGIAGPGGGSEDKPVGTVFIAVAQRGESPRTGREPETWCRRFRFSPNRVRVRGVSSGWAMFALWCCAHGEPPEHWVHRS